jgi:hypothetical protein
VEEEEWDDNPFENRPVDKKAVKKKAKSEPAAAPPPPGVDEDNPFERGIESSNSVDDDFNPFENRPGATPSSYQGDVDDDYIEIDEFDKSRLAFISGIGFVGLFFVLYFFVIVPGGMLLLGLAIASIIISILVAFFYLLDDLKIRMSSLTERGARFISGIFFMVLVIILFVPLMMHWPNTEDIDITIPLTLLPIIILTHGSVALFLYSMLWEE